MTRRRLRQFHSMMLEIMEEEQRRAVFGAYSLFGDDCAVLEKYKSELQGIRAWIDHIPDSVTRRAFRLRYVDGLPWHAVSCRMGYASESGARKLCTRYLESGKK